MHTARIAAVLAASICLPFGAKNRPEKADIILSNGKIFTGGSPKFVEAVAVRGERILAAGTTQEVTATATAATRRIDLGGRVAIPGINDAHFHMDWVRPEHLGLKSQETDPSCAQVLTRLKAEIMTTPENGLIMGEIGPSAFFDKECTGATLDRMAPRHAVALYSWSMNAAILNRAAVHRFDVPVTASPEAGFYGKDGRGKAWDGVVQEYAWWRLCNQISNAAGEDALRAQLSAFLQDAARYGITSLQVMSAEPERLFRMLGQFSPSIRVRVVSWPMEGMSKIKPALKPQVAGRVVSSGLKLILDGTPVERSMALRKPYHDDRSTEGRLNFPPETIRRIVQAAAETGQPLLLHACGDRTVEVVLQAMESTGAAAEWPKRRLRIEHGDGVMPDLIPRVKALGVIVVANPSHVMGSIPIQRLGPERARQMLLLRSLVEAGIPLALGSDGPLNPFLNIFFATTYPNNPREALTREQAVAAYTKGSAYAEFAEQEKGVLEPGKKADIAVLSQDIFEVPAPQLPKTESVLTMIGGRIVRQTL